MQHTLQRPVPDLRLDGSVTHTVNGLFHVTVDKAGDFWVTSTDTGSFVFVPTDPGLPIYKRHTTGWFGESSNNQNDVLHCRQSIHATAPGAPPVDFHEVGHGSTNAHGVPTVVFDKLSC